MSELNNIISKTLDRVEKKLAEQLTGSYIEEQINRMCLRVVSAGGKRLRPRLCVLSRYAIGSLADIDENRLVALAAAIELLHTSTLVHDDVIDKATVRRGVATLNETDGNHAAVLAGDYLFTRCFSCLHEIGDASLYAAVNETLAVLVKGEINQLHNQGNIDISIEDYEETIYCKTGALFELATSFAARLGRADKRYVRALSEYGKQLGIAFQVADDMLDYSSSTKQLGKRIGEDLSDGRVTLPLILALKHCPENRIEDFRQAILEDNLAGVLEYIALTDSLSLSREFALNAASKAEKALEEIENSEFKDELVKLAYDAVNRSK